MNRQPIVEAYRQNGALDRDCPQCDASPQQWCVDGRGRLRRVPCVGRTQIPAAHHFRINPEMVDHLADADNSAAQELVPGAGKVVSDNKSRTRVPEVPLSLDFSEPRHPAGGDDD